VYNSAELRLAPGAEPSLMSTLPLGNRVIVWELHVNPPPALLSHA
jgi:hypothetical protein